MNNMCKVPQHVKDGAIGAGCMEEKSFSLSSTFTIKK